MMWLFIYCYFGDEVTSRFEGISDTLYLCNWYLLPLKLKKSIPMTIYGAKKLIYLQGFGSNSCTRETFKKVSSNFIHLEFTQFVLKLLLLWLDLYFCRLSMPDFPISQCFDKSTIENINSILKSFILTYKKWFKISLFLNLVKIRSWIYFWHVFWSVNCFLFYISGNFIYNRIRIEVIKINFASI